jgi:Icc-related predicted phosphoesterase
MNIQFFSDVHLEFGALDVPQTRADVIVAAGDIDLGARAVPWLQRLERPTVYIAGNHEYYGGELGAVQQDIRAACEGTQVHFLERESVEIDGVRFVGATLWTALNDSESRPLEMFESHINDFRQIRVGERFLRAADVVALNRESVAWLRETLSAPFDGPTVVVTHHAPLAASWRADPDALLKDAYCNDLSRLLLQHPPQLWIHGHVHTRSDYLANQVRVVCNPRGYHGIQPVRGFDARRYVTLD